MSDNTTLLNQGNGYLQMKNLRKKQQENSIIMNENKEIINTNKAAFKEGFVESMDNSNVPFDQIKTTSISELNAAENEMFDKLKGEFDNAMSSYSSVQKSINQLSLEYVNEDKNKYQKNYYAQLPPEGPNDEDIKHQGCYRDNYWRGRSIPEWRGYMSKEECAREAAEQGKTVFGLQHGNRRPGLRQREEGETDFSGKGYCFVGDSLNRAKRHGIANYTRWNFWLSQYIRYFGFNQWRDFMNYQKDNGYRIYFRLNKKAQFEWYAWSSSQNRRVRVIWKGPGATNGKIKFNRMADTDYGGNDIGYFKTGSLDKCNKYCEKRSNCAAHNFRSDGDGCWLKYRWGTVNGKVYSKKNSNKTWDFYYKTRETVSCFLMIDDNGNVMLYQGTSPGDSNKKKKYTFPKQRKSVYSSEIPYITKNDDWLKRRKYGRNYIKTGQYLGPNEFICSDNGKYIFKIGSYGNILIGTNVLRCRDSNGIDIGGWRSNDVYTIPKTDVKYLGDAFYKNEDDYKFAYRDNDIRFKNSYKLAKKNFNTPGNDLGWKWVKTIEQAEAVCNADHRCAGFVYEKVSDYPGVSHGYDRVWKKSKNMWPSVNARRNKHTYCDIYIREIKLNNSYSCNSNVDEYVRSDEYTTLAGAGAGRTVYDINEQKNIQGSDIKYMNGATQKECEDSCTADNTCRAFVYNRNDPSNGGCYLKNQNSSGIVDDNNSDLYVKRYRSPSGMDGFMHRKDSCSIKKSTSQERNILEKKKQVLGQRMRDILKQMKELIEKAEKLNNKKNSTGEERIKMIYQYEQIFKKLEQEEDDVQILNQAEQDQEFILTSENYQYISLSIIAILITIFAFKFMKKQ